MENINPLSMLNFILMANKAANSISFALFTLSYKILILIVTLQDFLLQSFSYLHIRTWESYRRSVARKSKNVDSAVSVASILKPCINDDVKNETLIEGDIEIVMQKLGISWDSSGNYLQERLCLREISTLFYEIEPGPQEVKEAFDLFDDNKDGYIDAKDLEKILCTLGCVEISELECQRMIVAFSKNGEKRIDFIKFVKIIEDSFAEC
ncbi:hypothetical protein ACH5RR_025882 [Cinchona calisaya]|uniref:EF-hand domain-containing protein n=1 Tax=Cinchona calisaya TaxID=153742 RepID=A0ABD2Z4A3_9GENT